MSFILDTCAISELRKPKPNKGFLNWFKETNENELYISAISLGEVEFGITLLESGSKKDDIVNWFEKLKDAFSPRTLTVTTNISLRWGKLRATLRKSGLEIPVIDGLLAATAIEHDFVFITRNSSDFVNTEAKIYNPWS
jgi:predicted nucleic acid-binding protein